MQRMPSAFGGSVCLPTYARWWWRALTTSKDEARKVVVVVCVC